MIWEGIATSIAYDLLKWALARDGNLLRSHVLGSLEDTATEFSKHDPPLYIHVETFVEAIQESISRLKFLS